MEVIVISEDRLREIISECLRNLNSVPSPQPQFDVKHLHSIIELADFLGCSVTKAQQLKNSGKIPYIQFGRKCIFSSDQVLNALEEDNILQRSTKRKLINKR